MKLILIPVHFVLKVNFASVAIACDECRDILSEVGFNTHITNNHDPSIIKKYYGVD